jgi:hypothetical protein
MAPPGCHGPPKRGPVTPSICNAVQRGGGGGGAAEERRGAIRFLLSNQQAEARRRVAARGLQGPETALRGSPSVAGVAGVAGGAMQRGRAAFAGGDPARGGIGAVGHGGTMKLAHVPPSLRAFVANGKRAGARRLQLRRTRDRAPARAASPARIGPSGSPRAGPSAELRTAQFWPPRLPRPDHPCG